MDELLAFLCGLGCLLAAVTVIGHGLWVAIAWCGKQIVVQPAVSSAQAAGKPCPHCKSPHGVHHGICVMCGKVPQIAPGSALREELKTTARQLRRLLTAGQITQEHYDAVLQPIHAELSRLGLPPAAETSPVLPTPNFPQESLPIVLESAAAPSPPVSTPQVPVATADLVLDAQIVESPADVGSPFAPAPVARAPQPPQPHPLDRPVIAAAPAKAPVIQSPPQPVRSWADVLQSFMEESNIRWGEILAALLIVVSAVGLVISLRATLKAIPYFPALLFTLFTVAFHGAGMYTLRRWKLQAVSRVILIISLLLVPLTFSAAVVMSGTGDSQRPATDPLFLLALAIGLGVFGWVAFSASQELVGEGKWRLAAGVLIPSLSQVVIERTSLAGIGFWPLQLVAALPLAGFLAATGGQLWRARSWPRISWPRAGQTLLILGIAGFALLAPLVLLFMRVEPRLLAASRLSPVLSLAAAAVLATGLLLHRRATGKGLATIQLTGTAILICGGILLLLLVSLTWPEPELLLAVGLLNAVVLVALAIVAELPLLYCPAIACAALASVIGLHLAQGRFADRENLAPQIIAAALMGRSGLLLTILSLMAAAISSWLHKQRRAADALFVLASAGGVAAVSIAVALFSGFVTIAGWQQDADLAAPILLLFAVALIAAGPRTPWPAVAAAGSLLLWTALVQATTFNVTCRNWLAALHLLPERGIFIATLAHGFITAVVALVASWRLLGVAGVELRSTPADRGRAALDPSHTLIDPLATSSACSLAAVLPMILWVWNDQFPWHASFALWAAAAWGMLALVQRWPLAVSGGQVMLGLAPALVVAGHWHGRLGDDFLLSEPHAQGQMLLIAGWAVAWAIARRLSESQPLCKQLLSPPWPSVDQVLVAAVVLAIPVIELGGAISDIGWELGFAVPQVSADELNDVLANDLRSRLLLAALLAAVLVALWERVSVFALLGPGIVTFAAIWTLAQLGQPFSSVASTARWLAGIYAVFWGVVFILRKPIGKLARRQTWLRFDQLPGDLFQWFAAQPLVLGGTTILALTILAVVQSSSGVLLRGPVPGSIFAAMGPTASYAGPLMALVGVLLAYAIRQRQAAYALGGSLVFQLAVNLAFLLFVTTSPPRNPNVVAAMWLQWNALGAGTYALIWLALSRWITPDPASAEATAARIMRRVQVATAACLAIALPIWGVGAIFLEPALVPPGISVLGNTWSYLAALVAGVAVAIHVRGRVATGLGDTATWLAAALVALAACTAQRFDPGGQWIAYHTLTAGWLVLGLIATAVHALRSRYAPHHVSCAILAGLVTLLAIRGNANDPGQPWWSLGATLGPLAIAAALGLARRSQLYAYGSVLLSGLAMLLFAVSLQGSIWLGTAFGTPPIPPLAIVDLIAAAMILPAAGWLAAEIRYQSRLAESLSPRFFGPRVHATTLLAGLALLGAWHTILHIPYIDKWGTIAATIIPPLVLLGLGAALLGTLWDRRAWWILAALYCWGVVVWLLSTNLASEAIEPHVAPDWVNLPLMVLAAALQVAITGQLWSYGANWSVLGAKVGISDPVGGLARTEKWLVPVNLLVAAVASLLTLLLVLTQYHLQLRTAVALTPAIAAWGVLCLAQQRRRDPLQLASLLLAGLAAIYLAWAQIEPGGSRELWMTRTFRLLMVLASLTFIYGLALPRWLLTAGSWNAATRKAGYIAGVAALASFAAVLALEVSLYRPGQDAPIESVQIVAIGVVLLALIAGLLSLALLPGRDPLSLSEENRQWYVYAAEAVAALLFAHLYICRPTWFDGVLRPYWPLIIMLIAFAGVGAGELCQRWRIRVLAEPLARTGALLPLLPVLGWWIVGSGTDYALLLAVVGVLYLVLATLHKSWASLIAAVVAGNGALWSLFNSMDLNFAANPQFWLIPPALSALAAAQIHRRKLDSAQLAAIRYGATIVIYLSSTSEIFLRGIGDTLWPPMLLAGLAVAGAMAGIVLRIRAFLYLGSAFTLLALLAMVAHAARAIEHVWPWWAFGIGLGIAILVLFGVFEKNRPQMLALIAKLREWER